MRKGNLFLPWGQPWDSNQAFLEKPTCPLRPIPFIQAHVCTLHVQGAKHCPLT